MSLFDSVLDRVASATGKRRKGSYGLEVTVNGNIIDNSKMRKRYVPVEDEVEESAPVIAKPNDTQTQRVQPIASSVTELGESVEEYDSSVYAPPVNSFVQGDVDPVPKQDAVFEAASFAPPDYLSSGNEMQEDESGMFSDSIPEFSIIPDADPEAEVSQPPQSHMLDVMQKAPPARYQGVAAASRVPSSRDRQEYGKSELYDPGKEYEHEVAAELATLMSRYKGEVFYDLTVPRSTVSADGNDNTSQLDVVVVLPMSVVAIECKDWAGVTDARLDQGTHWYTSYPNGKIYENYSPVRQNATHIRSLAQYLEVDPTYIVSAVLFSSRGSVKNAPRGNANLYIGNFAGFSDFLAILSQTSMLRVPNVELLKSRLRIIQGKSEYRSQKHTETFTSRKESGRCPVCGGLLVKRTGTQGRPDFMGCSMYPRCKYTQSLG